MAVFFTNAIDITPADASGALKDSLGVVVTPQGTSGATSYSYSVVAKNAAGETKGSAGGTSTGNAVLDGVNFNRITWNTAGASATGYDIYRTAGGATQGKIGTTAGLTFDDTGLPGDATSPHDLYNSTGAWQDIDLASSGVPSLATGVAIRIEGPPLLTGAHATVGFRKKGSTDDRKTWHARGYSTIVFVGCDTDHTIQVSFDEDGTQDGVGGVKFYLLGYFQDSEAVFFDDAYDKTPGAHLTWTDIDCSAECPDAIAVIVNIQATPIDYLSYGGVRPDGSAQALTSSASADFPRGLIVGCSAAQIVEGYVFSGSANIWLQGYIKAGKGHFDTTWASITPGSTSFVNKSLIPPGSHTSALALLGRGASGLNTDGIREDGSTDNYSYNYSVMHPVTIVSDIVECKGSSVADSRIWISGYLYEHTEIDLTSVPIDVPVEMLGEDPEFELSTSILAGMLISPLDVGGAPIECSLMLDHYQPEDVRVSIVADLDIDQIGHIQLPVPQVLGQASLGWAFGRIRLGGRQDDLYDVLPGYPALSVSGTAHPGVVGTGNYIYVPPITVLGGIGNLTATGGFFVPPIRVLSSISPVGVVGVGSVLLPLPWNSVSADANFMSDLVADLEIPVIFVRGYGYITPIDAYYKSIVMNASNYAVTEYFDYKINAFAKFNQKLYATGPSGLYLMDGDTKLGSPIFAEFRGGLEDYREPTYEYIRSAWFTLKTDGQLEMTVQVGEDVLWTKDLQIFKKVLHEIRGKIARGLRDRYFALGLRNVNGSSFTVNSIRVKVEKTVGRTR